MTVVGREQFIGESIRQLRRQRNLTQSELGGERYSKSYVSALERDKITPSFQALQFFAEQLGQSNEYFTTLLEQTEHLKQLAVLSEQSHINTGEQPVPEGEWGFLDVLLKSAHYADLQALRDLPSLSDEAIATLQPINQARYAFLTGLIAQQKQQYDAALHAFESALAFAPTKYHAAILDALGRNYFLAHAYVTALNYHLRAFRLLQKEATDDVEPTLRLDIALHCGDDYRCLGAYQQACEMYEQARGHFNAEHDMKTAGSLYLGLGYCAYAIAYTTTTLAAPGREEASLEDIQPLFQRAISLLVQSRSVYQVSGDSLGEAVVRLTLAQAELDFSTSQSKLARQRTSKEQKLLAAQCASLLDDVEEHCRQIVLNWQETSGVPGASPAELDNIPYIALAYLISIYRQRATLARLSGHKETSLRESQFMSYLCQEVLDAFSQPVFPWTMLANTLSMRTDASGFTPPILPRLPGLEEASRNVLHSPISQVEVYFAAGEVAEELGRAAEEHSFARGCYMQANTFFLAALNSAGSVVTQGERDPGYMVRCHQRCIATLEERFTDAPDILEETATTLLTMLKNSLHRLSEIMLPINLRAH